MQDMTTKHMKARKKKKKDSSQTPYILPVFGRQPALLSTLAPDIFWYALIRQRCPSRDNDLCNITHEAPIVCQRMALCAKHLNGVQIMMSRNFTTKALWQITNSTSSCGEAFCCFVCGRVCSVSCNAACVRVQSGLLIDNPRCRSA